MLTKIPSKIFYAMMTELQLVTTRQNAKVSDLKSISLDQIKGVIKVRSTIWIANRCFESNLLSRNHNQSQIKPTLRYVLGAVQIDLLLRCQRHVLLMVARMVLDAGGENPQ